jgi:gamma-glutamyl hercynylcysteine S-oxide synthase
VNLSHAPVDRVALRRWYDANRERTRSLFASIEPEVYYDAPIPLRHPFVFYDGHLPAFSFLVLVRRALGAPAIDPSLERLFERGIDPQNLDSARHLSRSDWPDRERVAAFIEACDVAVRNVFEHAQLIDQGNPLLADAQAVYNILEHEEMHHETLTYIIHQLPVAAKHATSENVLDEFPSDAHAIVAIDAGQATLGKARDGSFGWDNEFPEHVVDVPAFLLDRYNVTNADYLAYVHAGGAVPTFWRQDGDSWRLRTAYDEIPLPLSWPVYATHQQATAFAHWSGGRLMTEAEFHRAAFGTPDGTERPYPWGSQAPDAQRHGNFDFRRFDPEPIGCSPEGASAWGVEDLIGNGWEWTSTPFSPFDGFSPMASYPQYSADFFDGRHFVMKGASPVTSRNLIRRSLRNWFYEDYPHMYATFRRAYDPATYLR